MSIADKLTKLATDIENAYTSIETKGGTIPSDKNTNNLSTAIDSITGGSIITDTATGEIVTITDSIRHQFNKLNIKGNTYQQTYTGKNIISSAMATEQRQKKFLFNKSKITTKVWFSVILSESIGNNNVVNIQYKDTAWKNISIGAMNFVANEKVVKAKTLTAEQVQAIKDSTDTVRVQIYCNDSSIDLRNITFSEAMLSTINNDTYEPYVGGIPAPSPNYPQTITNVSGTVNVKVANGTDSTASGYEEQTATLTLPSGMELCKIGNYQDNFIKVYNTWYKFKAINKVIFDGSEDEELEIYNSTSSRIAIQTKDIEDIKPYSQNNNDPELFCSHYTPVSGNTTWKAGQISRLTGSRLKLFFIIDTSYTLETFKTWLSTHNTTVYYVLNTPVLEEITDTTLIGQLDNLSNLYSYSGTTIISSIATVSPIFDVEYYKE